MQLERANPPLAPKPHRASGRPAGWPERRRAISSRLAYSWPLGRWAAARPPAGSQRGQRNQSNRTWSAAHLLR